MRVLDAVLIAVICFTLGGLVGAAHEVRKNHLELKALQAQVDKKYCEGEVTYPQLKEEFLK